MASLFELVQDTVSPLMKKLMRKLDPAAQRTTLLQWGAAVRKKAQDTAIGKGGRRFWRQIARSVNVREVSATAVHVASDHVAAAQMQYGGMIGAPGKHSEDPAQALTIPIPGSPAEGRRASEFQQDLFVPKGTSVLGYSIKREGGSEFVPLFILRKRVRGPHSPWFPTEREAGEIGERLAARRLAA